MQIRIYTGVGERSKEGASLQLKTLLKGRVEGTGNWFSEMERTEQKQVTLLLVPVHRSYFSQHAGEANSCRQGRCYRALTTSQIGARRLRICGRH